MPRCMALSWRWWARLFQIGMEFRPLWLWGYEIFAKEIDGFLEEEESGVLGGNGERGLRARSDGLSRDSMLSSDQEGIIEVQFGSAAKLGDDEVDR